MVRVYSTIFLVGPTCCRRRRVNDKLWMSIGFTSGTGGPLHSSRPGGRVVWQGGGGGVAAEGDRVGWGRGAGGGDWINSFYGFFFLSL